MNKVCRIEGDIYKSHLYIHSSIEVEYEIGKTSYPSIGCLFAFDNLKSVEHFLDYNGLSNSIILECEGEIADTDHEIKCSNANREYINIFWKDRQQFFLEHSAHTFRTPKGTIYCNWIKPIKVIGE